MKIYSAVYTIYIHLHLSLTWRKVFFRECSWCMQQISSFICCMQCFLSHRTHGVVISQKKLHLLLLLDLLLLLLLLPHLPLLPLLLTLAFHLFLKFAEVVNSGHDGKSSTKTIPWTFMLMHENTWIYWLVHSDHKLELSDRILASNTLERNFVFFKIGNQFQTYILYEEVWRKLTKSKSFCFASLWLSMAEVHSSEFKYLTHRCWASDLRLIPARSTGDSWLNNVNLLSRRITCFELQNSARIR